MLDSVQEARTDLVPPLLLPLAHNFSLKAGAKDYMAPSCSLSATSAFEEQRVYDLITCTIRALSSSSELHHRKKPPYTSGKSTTDVTF
jgi:hypothetical protein